MNKSTIHSQAEIYPGCYVPKALQQNNVIKLKTTTGTQVRPGPVRVTELQETYKIEVPLPCVKRDDIVLYANKNSITIIVSNVPPILINQNDAGDEPCRSLEKKITLPGNVDSEFMSAEYYESVLYLHVPKNVLPVRCKPANIVVY